MVSSGSQSKAKRGKDFIGVGVGAVIINDQREILLLLRRNPPEAGYWTIPGGAVEWFELCADAIRRECLEEVGLVVEVGRLLKVVDHIVETDESHWVSMEYLCTVDPNADSVMNADKDESIDLRWFSLDELPELMTQPTREAIECYLESSGNALQG